MGKPIVDGTDLEFATNTNYAGGPDVGTATKSEFETGRKADGWRKGNKPPAQEFNWWMSWIADWVRFLYDEMLSPLITDAGVLKADTVDTVQIVDRAVTRIKAHDGINLIKNCSGEIGGDADGETGYPYWFADTGDVNPPIWEAFNTAALSRGPYFTLNDPALAGGTFIEDVSVAYPLNTSGNNIAIAVGAEAIAVGTGAEVFLVITAYDDTAGTSNPDDVGFVGWSADGFFEKKVVGMTVTDTAKRSFRVFRRLRNDDAGAQDVTGLIRNIMVSGGSNAEDPTEARIFQLPPAIVGDVDDTTIELVKDIAQVKDNGITLAKLAGGTADRVFGTDGSGDPELAQIVAGQIENVAMGELFQLSGNMGGGVTIPITASGLRRGQVIRISIPADKVLKLKHVRFEFTDTNFRLYIREDSTIRWQSTNNEDDLVTNTTIMTGPITASLEVAAFNSGGSTNDAQGWDGWWLLFRIEDA